MQFTVYGTEDCCLVPKVELTAKICGSSVKMSDPKNMDCEGIPFKRYPALDAGSCGVVSGSAACVRFLANAHPMAELYGCSLSDKAAIDASLDGVHAELELPMMAINRGASAQEAKAELAKTLADLNNMLAKNTFLVGQRMSIADVALAGIIKTAEKKKAVDMSKYLHVQRLVETVNGRAKSPMGPKPASVAKSTPANPPAAAAAAPAAAAAAAPKVKDPLELLPPSTMDMDEWKRTYSNIKDLDQAMEWLWKNLDKEGYSFYHTKYLRCGDDDNTEGYKASNLIGMHLQRMENSLRKYMFGVYDVLKMDGFYDIEGVLMVRGQDIPVKLQEHDQYESFVFTKLNVDDPKDKQMIRDFFVEGDEIAGKPIDSCKVYK